ncbi:MAG: DNA-binding response regulator [Verrucomicrobia bacterium]|nr:MAG: DNA-binding response regulator [Verrucomicrobiota bacterium]
MNPVILFPAPREAVPGGLRSRIRILLADASARVRAIVYDLVESLQVPISVSACSDALEALILGSDLHPSLVLIGEHLTGLPRRELAWRLLSRDPDLRVLYLTADPDRALTARDASVGIRGVLHEDRLAAELAPILAKLAPTRDPAPPGRHPDPTTGHDGKADIGPT